MNATEFNEWVDDYQEHFPSVAKWLAGLGRLAAPQLKLWRRILTDTPLAGAKRVTAAMAVGTLEPVGAFDWQRERTAVVIRRCVADLDRDEQPTDRPRRAIRERPATTGPTLREAVERVGDLVKSGRSFAEAAAEVVTVDDDDDGRRVSCPVCRDEGYVTVWHAREIEHVRVTGEVGAGGTMCRPCSCAAGDRKVWSRDEAPPKGWSGWRNQYSRYDPRRDCVANLGTTSDDARAEFATWCTAYFESLDQQAETAEELF